MSTTSTGTSLPTIENFDPTDKKYQVSPDFPPDKESTYHYPIPKDGWYLAHNCLRYQIDEFHKCLVSVRDMNNKSKSNDLLEWQVVALQCVFDVHSKFVHEHHETEDTLAVEFQKRFRYPDKVTANHKGLLAQMTKVENMVKDLKAGSDTKTVIGALMKEFETYRDGMLPHLQEEEEFGLPLVRAYFDRKDYSKLVETTRAKHKFDAVLVGSMLYGAGVDNWKDFMKQEGIPFFVWYIVFGPSLRKYEKLVVPQVKALLTGVEPIPPTNKWWCC